MRLAGWKSGWTNGYKGKCKSNISTVPVRNSKRRLITSKIKRWIEEQATHKMCNEYTLLVVSKVYFPDHSAPEESRPFSNFLNSLACRTNVKMCIYIYIFFFYTHI